MATLALEQNIDRIRSRIRLLLAVRWSVLFTLGGTALSLVVLVAAKLAGRPFWIEEDSLFLVLCALAGALFGATRRVTPFQAAVLTDRRLGLQERLSSALDFMGTAGQDPMAEALVADATERSAGIDVRAAYPVHAPRETRYLAAALAVLLGAVFLPGLSIFQSARQRAENEAIKAEGERIVHIAKEMRKAADKQNIAVAQRVAQNMEQLGKQMRSGQIGKKAALVKLNKLTKDVKEAQKALAAKTAKKSLAQAAEELKNAAKGAASDPKDADAAKRLKEMADALAKNDMDQAAKLLQQMANDAASGKLSKQQMESMAKQAEQMAKAMSGTQLQQAANQLQQAAQQLRQQQTASAAQQMRQAGGT